MHPHAAQDSNTDKVPLQLSLELGLSLSLSCLQSQAQAEADAQLKSESRYNDIVQPILVHGKKIQLVLDLRTVDGSNYRYSRGSTVTLSYTVYCLPVYRTF